MIKDHQILTTPAASLGNSLPLPYQCQQAFKQINCPAFRVNQLTSGIKLAKLVNSILYDGKNTILTNQIISQNEERKGNNVINMNMVLKQVRNNSKIQVPQHIHELTTFKLIDSEQDMIDFVKWLINCLKSERDIIESKKTRQPHIQQSKQNLQKNMRNYGKPDHNQSRMKDHKSFHNRVLQPYSNEYEQRIIQNYERDFDYNNKLEVDEKKQENIFENVYFLDRDLSPEKAQYQMNDSLQLSEKVSKKGSFKVVRPKTIFSDSQNGDKNTNMKDIDSPEKQKEQKYAKNNNGSEFPRYYSDQKQSSDRKTIPKMPQRPPIYRKLNKQQTKTQSVSKNSKMQNFKDPAPFVTQSLEANFQSIQKAPSKQDSRYHNISSSTQKQPKKKTRMQSSNMLQQISQLQQQIKRQKSQILKQTKHTQNRSQSIWQNNLQNSKKAKSNRKIFKIDIKQVGQTQRKNIIQWLISINLLNSMATNYYDRFHQICKNGVIFPQILNYHRGKSNQLYYFKNPTKSAQVHSNYQKVFACLKQIPNFESQLLFMYDYFVPEALQNAFWSLLKSCQQCFQKIFAQKTKVFNKQTEIKQRLKTKPDIQSNSRSKVEQMQNRAGSLKKSKVQDQYQKIKYGSTNKFKQMVAKSTTKTIKEPQSRNSAEKEQKMKRKSSLDFIKQLPEKQTENLKHQELIQIQQPVQFNKAMKGYKQLHELKKSNMFNSFINTPQKKNENSISRSRIVSTNSLKKGQEKPEPPSITLQMQMKALKYLKQKGHLNLASMQTLSLFDDPIRNGVLFNKIIIQELKTNYKYVQKPRNIVDCRQNFKKGLSQLKQLFIMVPFCYEFYFEQIIKGQMNLFYGLVWHIICANFNKASLSMGPNALKNESAIMNISKNYNQFEINQNQSLQQQILFWVRELEQENSQIASLQIRDINSLLTTIVTSNLLYKLSVALLPEKYTIKPTYEQPLTQMEQQSNIKKILSFFSHNKILRSDLIWKSKSIVKKQKGTTIQILKQLMNYHKNTKKSSINTQKQNPVVSFIKFTRQNSREQIKNNQKVNERLETTIGHNSFSAPLKKQNKQKVEKKQPQPIQVSWMRALGFTEDLSINNGVILCRLMCKLTMQSVNYNETPASKAECLTNIRKALKLIDKFKWDEQDIASADEKTTLEIYKFIKQKYKHSYAMKSVL